MSEHPLSVPLLVVCSVPRCRCSTWTRGHSNRTVPTVRAGRDRRGGPFLAAILHTNTIGSAYGGTRYDQSGRGTPCSVWRRTSDESPRVITPAIDEDPFLRGAQPERELLHLVHHLGGPAEVDVRRPEVR